MSETPSKVLNNELIPCIVVEPKTKPKHCVIWMHGLGANGHDFEPVAPQLGLPEGGGVRFIFPHAPVRPVTLNQGYAMPAWYDIVDLTPEGRDDAEGLRQSSEAIDAIIQQQIADGIPASQIILAGFSQGGALALHMGLRYPKKLAGIMALSSYLPQANVVMEQVHDANRGTNIFMAHGIADDVVPLAMGEASLNLLTEMGYKPSWHTYPMAHSVCLDEITDIGSWIKDCFEL